MTWVESPSPMTSCTSRTRVVLRCMVMAAASFLVQSQTSTSSSIMDKPFQSIYNLPHSSCVTLYHRNGRIGCGTFSSEPQIGRLVRFDNTNGVPNLSQSNSNGGDVEQEQLVVVMEEAEFTTNNVALVQQAISNANSNNVAVKLSGMLITNTTSSSDNNNDDGSFSATSPGSSTPNGYNTPSANLNPRGNYEWNTLGTNLEFQNYYGIPISYVGDADVAAYLSQVASQQATVSEEESESQGSVLAEFNYYMGGAGVSSDSDDSSVLTSKDCLMWKNVEDGAWNPKCAPLGGQSIWATAGPLKTTALQNNENGNNNNAENGGEENGGEQRSLAEENDQYYYNANNNNNRKPVLLVGATMDGSSMFHELSPSASSAASNILVTLLAAKLVGLYVDADTLENTLSKQIVFSLFQGDSYGFMGSRRFLRDVLNGVECTTSVQYNADADQGKTYEPLSDSCLYPMRPSLAFQELGQIYGILSVDQVGVLATENTLYVHASDDGEDGNNDPGAFIANVLLQCTTDNYATAQTSTAADDYGVIPLPPTPLTSLLSVSGNAVGGAVISGYDDAFVADGKFRSHLDSTQQRERDGEDISLEALVNAAIIMARAAVAVAYDDGSGNSDAATAVQFANNLIASDVIDENDSTAQSLYKCLFVDGNCEFLSIYAKVKYVNDVKRTGVDLGSPTMLGNPPSYYVSIYYPYLNQASVQVGGQWFGAYDPTQEREQTEGSTSTTTATYPAYGESKNDVILMNPSGLEAALHGLLNDFLGRSSAGDATLKSCSTNQGCQSGVDYCSADNLEYATCTGGLVCVCSRAHYHDAVDEALEAKPNEFPNKFDIVDDNDNNGGVSALYTEPYWSSSVGVKVYRKAGENVNKYVIGFGAATAIISFGLSFVLKRELTKAKLH
jgi:nicastrin